ncbi:MAG: HdeD family acid-resistance protein [Novosphingobium sp.]|uniref:HdeD family acid-resistance protein n=1 Tax=Novosphingobium sp. TaxID=1874826 RepID=UPI0012C8C79C|nr:HdeD family acid-resistance protein [Novosphingobium sp.]MPS67055.1 HdeD family acid-resistance protein [Novosphingobium sp.]
MTRTEMDPLLEPNVENDPLVSSLKQASGKAWGWVLAYGVLLMLIALLVVSRPLVAGVATGLLVGVVLVIYGIAAIASGWTSLSQRARWVEILLGLLALIAGVFALVNPVAGALSLVWAIGAWLLVSGGFQIAFALKARHDKGWRLFLGVLDVLLGFVLLFSSPGIGLAFLAIIIMVSLVVRGVFLIMLALALRKSAQA